MKKLHFIAIAGTGMGSAAGIFKEAGFSVKGSDQAIYPPMSTVLDNMNISLFSPFSDDNLNWEPDEVVVGNVCRKDHLEVLAAQKLNLPLTSFPQLLGREILSNRFPIIVAGTHGKTTTSTMLSFLLESAGKNPGWLIGGVPNNLKSGFSLGKGDLFVLEGDEYDTAFFDKNPKFVRYRPAAALLTGVEFDHADIYPDLETIVQQFHRLSALVPPENPFLGSADNEICRNIANIRGSQLYGLKEDEIADWLADDISYNTDTTTFTLFHRWKSYGQFTLKMSGEHNLRNITGALAMAITLGADPEILRAKLPEFSGIKKRQELIGITNQIEVIDDFGHHPTAVGLTIDGLRNKNPKRIIAVFEPRSATSRRKMFETPYVKALGRADLVIIAKPGDQSRIPENERLSSEIVSNKLNESGTKSVTLSNYDAILKELTSIAKKGDLIVFFSSGSFGGIQQKLFKSLQNI
jgi:UDP-N-acetylmuramate: L-alanyl-gamma-D-glutamyl-meso-diaminopimelate ligase